MKLLEMAGSIAFEDDMLNQTTEDESDDISEVRLLLSAAAVKNAVQVLCDMGRITEANVTYQRFLELGISLEELEEMSFSSGESHSARAA